MKSLSLVVAMSINNVIGRDGVLPWNLPSDLRHFRRITSGKTVIMGRKTWNSLHTKPLPHRNNIVITRNKDFLAEGGMVAYSLDMALGLASDSVEVMVIGGQEIYQLAIPRANRIYLTTIQDSYDGDAYFPNLNPSEWEEVGREDHPADGGFPSYSFLTLERFIGTPN